MRDFSTLKEGDNTFARVENGQVTGWTDNVFSNTVSLYGDRWSFSVVITCKIKY